MCANRASRVISWSCDPQNMHSSVFLPLVPPTISCSVWRLFKCNGSDTQSEKGCNWPWSQLEVSCQHCYQRLCYILLMLVLKMLFVPEGPGLNDILAYTEDTSSSRLIWLWILIKENVCTNVHTSADESITSWAWKSCQNELCNHNMLWWVESNRCVHVQCTQTVWKKEWSSMER